MSEENVDPRAEYRRRLQERESVLPRLEAHSRRISMARLLSFLAILAAIIAAWQEALPSWCTAVPILAFVVLVVVHDRVFRGLDRARRAAAHYRRGLDRLDDRWFGRGVTRSDLGVVGGAEGHPFAADLDLFGEGSLFERCCRARTRAGEETLARWLSPGFDGSADGGSAGGRVPLPSVAEIRERQQAVAAGRGRLDLREELDVRGDERTVAVHPQQLIDWGRAPAVFARAGALKVAGWLSPPVLVASLVAWVWGLGPWALLLLLAVNGLILRQLQPKLRRVAGPADRRGGELAILAELLAVFEGAEADDPRLRSLRAALQGEGSASAAIAKLRRLVAWYEAQHNALFMPIALACSWAPSFALAIEGWRARHGPHIRRWIEALSELEALSSLAGYAYENPEDPFPELVDDEGGDEARVLAGEGLGHPLLPRATCVRNDLSLGGELRAYVVSGSNMSGKSTFLRTVGCNVVLALLGAPVRARALRLSPLQIGATLRVQDSLQEGTSRFWAELTRLRTITEQAAAGPTLFLLDEIFHGTNSHDRRIGAEALLRSLLARDAVGLLTTHDLALAEAAEALAPAAVNVHFQDELRDGELVFDYRMREGVVRRSNALELMRSVGLDV